MRTFLNSTPSLPNQRYDVKGNNQIGLRKSPSIRERSLRERELMS